MAKYPNGRVESLVVVEEHDTMETLVRKVRRAEGTVVVIDDVGFRLLRSDANLRLLKYYAEEAGKTVVVSSPDYKIVELARAQGLGARAPQDVVVEMPDGPAGREEPPGRDGDGWETQGGEPAEPKGQVLDESPGQLAESMSQGPEPSESEASGSGRQARRMRRHQGRRGTGWAARLAAAAIALVTLGVFGWYFFWPRAVVVVIPSVVTHRAQVTVTAVSEEVSPDVGARVVAGKWIDYVLEHRATVPATGYQRIGVSKAEGVVAFINDTKSAIKVPKGTRLSTGNGVEFETLQDVTVPPVSFKYLMDQPVRLDAGVSEVNVLARQPGSQGNVSAGRITKFASGVKAPVSSLKVTNPEPTSGGTDRTAQVATLSDLEAAQKALEKDIRAACEKEAADEVMTGYEIVPGTLTWLINDTWYDAGVGDEAKEVTAIAAVSGKALAVRPEDVRKVAYAAFSEGLPEGVEVADQGLVKLEMSAAAASSSESWPIEVTVEAPVVSAIRPREVARELAGKSVSSARQSLGAWEAVGQFDIRAGSSEVMPAMARLIRVVVLDPPSR